MDEKKNIDRLFQEKFKDFEAFPDASVWKNIERRILKKKKRRIIPLWLRFGGAAAILLLLVSSGFWVFNQNSNLKEQPTKIIITDVNKNDELEEENLLIKEDNVITFKKTQTNQKENKNIKTVTKNYHQGTNSKIINNLQITTPQQNVTIAKNQQNGIISQVNNPNKSAIEKKINVEKELINSEKTAIAQEEVSDKQLDTKIDIQEELEKATTIEKVAESSTKKWSIGSTVAPIYYNTLTNSSPIDPSLASNTKNSNGSVSYGLKMNYKLSNKLTLQSGINRVELGYSTKNVTVLLSSSLLDESSTNISTNVDGVSVAALSTTSQNDVLSQRSSFDLAGSLDQTLSYIEVPLEAKYNLLQKKLGVNVIGGFSTYLLYQNQVSITSFGKTSTLGEASNINALNFSGNLGLDFDYNITKKLFINVSPMFKYQFNTFSENSGGFQPYYFGVYTGLNFRF